MDFTGERYFPGVSGSVALEHEHRYRFCLDIVKGCRVLDIACGEGFGSAMLAGSAEEVWGVDIDAEAVAHAKEAYQRANLHYVEGSCAAIPLPDGAVDVVISFETIEHHDAHDMMMREIRRVLRPGGVLVISSPDKRVYSEARNFHNKFHVKELYAEEFVALLESYFTHVSMYGQRVVYGSVILPYQSCGQIRSYGVDSIEPVSGLPNPIYQMAIASDEPSWAERGCGGLLEETVYRSEAIIERTLALRKEIKALKRMKEPPHHLRAIGLRLAFHSNGKPRGWVRSLLLKDRQSGTPRALTRRVLFKKDGRVRPVFANWYARYDSNRANFIADGYAVFLRRLLDKGALSGARTLRIITTPHTEFIGVSIAAALAKTRIRVAHSTSIPSSFEDDLYIVVAPQMFKNLPPAERTIMVQMEQMRASNWANGAYLSRLSNSIAVLDYSRDNISILIERGLPPKQIYYMPIRPLSSIARASVDRNIDVLFYGAISERRQRYIDALSRRVNLRIETNLFGIELQKLLDRTKIVVNMHFYENALLETTRISEALSHGARVISEEAVDQLDRSDFDRLVDFVPTGDIDAFVDRVEFALSTWTASAAVVEDQSLSGTAFHVLRALHGCGILSLDELERACEGRVLPGENLILALPEQTTRYNFAIENQIADTAMFHGLRNIDSWKGCAQSYKFLAKLALENKLSELMIYEDDADFGADITKRLGVIKRYLAKLGTEWDIFSGLITDLHAEAKITGIERFESEEFIHLDKTVGMVFGIYNRTALELLAAFDFRGNDVMKHTIDRYLEAMNLRCVTSLPPIAGHNEYLNSTLWQGDNLNAVGMIAGSLARLESKRKAWLSKNSVSEPAP